MDFKLK